MNLGNLVMIVVYFLLIERMTCLDHRDDFPMMSALVFMMHTRDGNGAGHFGYPPRPAPNGTGYYFPKRVWDFF